MSRWRTFLNASLKQWKDYTDMFQAQEKKPVRNKLQLYPPSPPGLPQHVLIVLLLTGNGKRLGLLQASLLSLMI